MNNRVTNMIVGGLTLASASHIAPEKIDEQLASKQQQATTEHVVRVAPDPAEARKKAQEQHDARIAARAKESAARRAQPRKVDTASAARPEPKRKPEVPEPTDKPSDEDEKTLERKSRRERRGPDGKIDPARESQVKVNRPTLDAKEQKARLEADRRHQERIAQQQNKQYQRSRSQHMSH